MPLTLQSFCYNETRIWIVIHSFSLKIRHPLSPPFSTNAKTETSYKGSSCNSVGDDDRNPQTSHKKTNVGEGGVRRPYGRWASYPTCIYMANARPSPRDNNQFASMAKERQDEEESLLHQDAGKRRTARGEQDTPAPTRRQETAASLTPSTALPRYATSANNDSQQHKSWVATITIWHTPLSFSLATFIEWYTAF